MYRLLREAFEHREAGALRPHADVLAVLQGAPSYGRVEEGRDAGEKTMPIVVLLMLTRSIVSCSAPRAAHKSKMWRGLERHCW